MAPDFEENGRRTGLTRSYIFLDRSETRLESFFDGLELDLSCNCIVIMGDILRSLDLKFL